MTETNPKAHTLQLSDEREKRAMSYNEQPTTLTEEQKHYLGGIAMCHKGNVGRLPKTMKELVDHWHDIADKMLAPDASDDMFDTDLIPECNWLRRLLERPDADALLAEAIKIDTAFRATLTDAF
jgi:hypothetical protein